MLASGGRLMGRNDRAVKRKRPGWALASARTGSRPQNGTQVPEGAIILRLARSTRCTRQDSMSTDTSVAKASGSAKSAHDLREMRRAMGWSVPWIADHCAVPEHHIRSWEDGSAEPDPRYVQWLEELVEKVSAMRIRPSEGRRRGRPTRDRALPTVRLDSPSILRRMRQAMGWSLPHAASMYGVSPSLIQGWECGRLAPHASYPVWLLAVGTCIRDHGKPDIKKKRRGRPRRTVDIGREQCHTNLPW